mgnify:FL=1
MTKVCKEIWHNHELRAYCKGFKDTAPSKTTTPVDDCVTCNDCIVLIGVEQEILARVMA